MNETEKQLNEVFPKLPDDASVSKYFPFFFVTGLRYNADRTVITVQIRLTRIFDLQVMEEVRELIRSVYFPDGTVEVSFDETYELPPVYDLSQILREYRASLIRKLSDERPAIRRMLENAEWTVDGDTVAVHVDENPYIAKFSKYWASIITGEFRDKFSMTVEAVIQSRAPQRKIFTTEAKLQNIQDRVSPEKKAENGPSEEEDDSLYAEFELYSAEHGSDMESDEMATLQMRLRNAESTASGLRKPKSDKGSVVKGTQDENVLYGNRFKDHPRALSSFRADEEGPMTVRGRVMSIKTVPLKKGEKSVVIFGLSDDTDSINVKLFVKNEEAEAFEMRLKDAKWVTVKGVAAIDLFDKEPVLQSVKGILKCDPPKKSGREDRSDVKRVELHCHTHMSKNDAIAPPEALIERAVSWGHPALAITDHGVAYAFPNAAKAADKYPDFKPIYGVEGYMVDDTRETVEIVGDLPVDRSAVVFDIETTGLSPVKNRIIEIAAVKIENGLITDRFSTFVNPKVPIPVVIELTTSINDDAVKDAPTIEEVLPKFLQFIEGSYLVAHNASFDVGFIRENTKRLGLTPTEFSYVDTLGASRVLIPKLSHYRLDQVAKELGVPLGHHHRAIDDAECTAYIFLKLLNRLSDPKPDMLSGLRDVLKLTDSAVRKLYSYHVILLAKNETGRVNLYRLCSEASLKYYNEKPLMPKSLIRSLRDGIIVGSACSEGELYQAILEEKSEEEIARIASFYDYLEIQPIGNNEYLIRDEKSPVSSDADLKAINKRIVKLGEAMDKPVVATGDVHFLDPEDSIYREILEEGNGFKDAAHQPPLYLRTTEEMLAEFNYLGRDKSFEVVVTNPNAIASQIEKISPVIYKSFPPVIERSDETLREICYREAKRRYGDPLPREVEERLEKELTPIIKHGYAVMYLIARKLVLKSVSDGYVVGSRGSVGSSLVATFAGITEVNPLPQHYLCPNCRRSIFDSDELIANKGNCACDLPDKICPDCGTKMKKEGFDIPFETFLGFHGEKLPDIDLNFSGEYQTKAHAYTEVIFGKGQTFRAGTITGIAEKTAFGYVKHYYEEHGIRKRKVEIERQSGRLVGIRRSTGQHPGGIVVLPFGVDINSITPVQHPADDPHSSIVTTSFEYHAIEKNLLKLDILGHDDPTMMRMLQDLIGIDPQTFPLDDPTVITLFESTESLGLTPKQLRGCPIGALGVPEFGTDFAMNMVIACKPKNFSDLVRISGMAHGTDVWSNNNQILFETGQASLATAICCRDDIMLYLISMGLEKELAFKIMESVRKGRGLKEEWEEEILRHNVPEWYTWSCNKIKYMFPKAHAVAYVMMAWRIAYCKLHYPLAFYCSHFTVRADEFNYEKMALGKAQLIRHMEEYEKQKFPSDKEKKEYRIMLIVNEMYERGFEFTKIDPYQASATLFKIVDDKRIMPSFTSIDGMGESAADSIVAAVHDGKGPFSSVQNFKDRTKVSKTLADKMFELGILGDIPEDDQFSIFDLSEK